MDMLSSIEKLSKSIHQKPWYSSIDSVYEHSGCLSVELPLSEFKSYFADVYDYYIHNFFLLEDAAKNSVLNKAEFVLVCCKMLQHRVHRLRQELSRSVHQHQATGELCPCAVATKIEWTPLPVALALDSVGIAKSEALHRTFVPCLPDELEVKRFHITSDKFVNQNDNDGDYRETVCVAEAEEFSSRISSNNWGVLLERWETFGKLIYHEQIKRNNELRKQVEATTKATSRQLVIGEHGSILLPIHLRKLYVQGRLYYSLSTSVNSTLGSTEIWSYANDTMVEDVMLASLLLPSTHKPKFHSKETEDGQDVEEQDETQLSKERRVKKGAPVKSHHSMISCSKAYLRKMVFSTCERILATESVFDLFHGSLGEKNNPPGTYHNMIQRKQIYNSILHSVIGLLKLSPPKSIVREIPVAIHLSGSFENFAREMFQCITEPKSKRVSFEMDKVVSAETIEEFTEDEFVFLCKRLIELKISEDFSEAILQSLHVDIPAPLALVLWSLSPCYCPTRGLFFCPTIEEDSLTLECRNKGKQVSNEDILEELCNFGTLHRKLSKLSLRNKSRIPFVDLANSYRSVTSNKSFPTTYFYTLQIGKNSTWVTSSCDVPRESVALASLFPDISTPKYGLENDSHKEDWISNWKFACPIFDESTLKRWFDGQYILHPTPLPAMESRALAPAQRSANRR